MTEDVVRVSGVRELLSRLRVLIVNQSLEMGGAERQSLYLARYLKDELGSEVHVWGSHLPGLAMQRCQEWGIECRIVPMFYDSLFATFSVGASRFVRECKRLRPSIILPYTHPANVMCALAWRLTGAGACVWNQRDPGQQRFALPLEKLAVKATPYFVANSCEGAAFLTDELGAAPDLVRVVRNGVPTSQDLPTRHEARREFGFPEDTLIACMVANLHSGKDHTTLVTAWKQVKDELATAGHRSLLVLAGRDGGEQERLVRLAEELELDAADILYMGQMSQPNRLFRAADLCVQSTKHEGCSNAVLEAMSLGLPVVGTDLGSMRETLGENFSEWLAPPYDASGLARRIIRLLLDEELRHRVGRENRERANRLFSLEAMCENMTNLIASIAQEKRIPPGRHRRV
ncbi:MAG: glycosyltransferase family 4 protein [Thermoleophilia bacterium]|nr:glycosyltransferase family 4 protein [Thermoleophilia bacterium]